MDWTGGPAKWAAVCVLAALTLFALVWSITSRQTRPELVRDPRLVQSVGNDRTVEDSQSDSNQASAGTSSGMPKSFKPPKAPVGTININTASAAELALLPGVGPAMAARIIEYRQKSGGFKAVDEIDRVRGVGPKTLEKLRPHLRISDEGTPQSPLPPG